MRMGETIGREKKQSVGQQERGIGGLNWGAGSRMAAEERHCQERCESVKALN